MIKALVASLVLTPLLLAQAPAPPYREPVLLCRFQDIRINESSGLAASARTDDYFFTHNDSGDGPRVYAVNRQGATLATFTVKGAESMDWEDMARGPGEEGKPALYLADIGDNLAQRPLVSLYRVREPQVDVRQTGVSAETETATRYDLEYEDGPHDAEALLVHPATGQCFLVTKSPVGSALYTAAAPLRVGIRNRLRKVAEVKLAPVSRRSGSLGDVVLRRLITGGDISPDGRRVVLRTYTDAYEWKVERKDVAGAFRGEPAVVPVPAAPGGEAIAYDRRGRSLLASTEGRNAPVHALRRR